MKKRVIDKGIAREGVTTNERGEKENLSTKREGWRLLQRRRGKEQRRSLAGRRPGRDIGERKISRRRNGKKSNTGRAEMRTRLPCHSGRGKEGVSSESIGKNGKKSNEEKKERRTRGKRVANGSRREDRRGWRAAGCAQMERGGDAVARIGRGRRERRGAVRREGT